MMPPKFIRFAAVAALVAFAALAFYKYRQPRFLAGEMAPNSSFSLADGTRLQLSDMRGKYVLLQFWGSWCGPCRKENPHLAQLYQQYAARGFEVVSVGIEQSTQAWQRAIQQDGMAWKYHTMEAADFSGPLAQEWNIHSIPTIFLLNPEGRIMGASLRQEQLDKMLEQKLASR
jgi:thiol-disulfide isomerase/thioredoxin